MSIQCQPWSREVVRIKKQSVCGYIASIFHQIEELIQKIWKTKTDNFAMQLSSYSTANHYIKYLDQTYTVDERGGLIEGDMG